LFDEGRARRITSKQAIEMRRRHARVADDAVQSGRIHFPQRAGTLFHGGRQAALSVGIASAQKKFEKAVKRAWHADELDDGIW
jgi:hypothetical protein